jgi:putative restriction endonuclease
VEGLRRHRTLHGCNGLLLAPHVDHLFDQGLISFASNGDLLIADATSRDVLSAWGIEKDFNAGEFSSKQQTFLAYHRACT